LLRCSTKTQPKQQERLDKNYLRIGLKKYIKFGSSPAWILSGGEHHTSFNYDVTPQQICDFEEMADIESLLIDESTIFLDSKKSCNGMRLIMQWAGVFDNP